MKFLTKEQIISLHSALIDRYGGSKGIRDEGLLDSALNAPFQTFSGKELYPDIFAKAARLAFGLIANHPFIDGNKRIGTHARISEYDVYPENTWLSREAEGFLATERENIYQLMKLGLTDS